MQTEVKREDVILNESEGTFDYLTTQQINTSGIYRKYFKRPMDIVLSLIALIVLSPIMLIIAILVKIKLGSPVLFKQKRPGLNEEIFTLYKFRTMTDERDENGELLSDSDRLTKFGRFLRSTSLDELPELFNILKGDMSIVGPRPLLIKYLPYYTAEEGLRHTVRPGLTGLSQINGRNFLEWDKRLNLDVKYISKISFMQDLKIIFFTLKRVMQRRDIAAGSQHILKNLDIERKITGYDIFELKIRDIERFKSDILELFKQSFKQSFPYETFANDTFINKIEKLKRYMLENKAIIYGFKGGSQLIGFVWFFVKANTNGNTIHINHFVVHEKFRRQGIGKSLINSVEQYAKEHEIQNIELLVTKENQEAVNFYKSRRFEIKRFIMKKRLL